MVRRLYQSNNAYKYHEPFTVARTAECCKANKTADVFLTAEVENNGIITNVTEGYPGNKVSLRQSRAGLNSLLGKYPYLILRKCICSVC